MHGRKIICNQYGGSLGEILRQLRGYKGVEIIEGHLMPDHVYMLVSIPPKVSVLRRCPAPPGLIGPEQTTLLKGGS